MKRRRGSAKGEARHAVPLPLLILLIAFIGGILANGCSTSGSDIGPTLMVAAASSLRGAFDDIARAFEEETGTSVTISFGSSGQLAQQIENGAPFDVFASANEAYVDRLAERGFVLLDTRRVYARGRLALVVNRERGASVKRLEDLADPSLGPIAIANPDHAPYGLAAYQALERRRLWEQVRSRIVMGENVRQALQFVQIGDAPVGIVALSIADVPEVDYTPISTELHDPLNQTLVILRDSRHPELARRFVAFVTGTAGRAILQRYGFLLPEEP